MKILVLGCGLMGLAAAKDLVGNDEVSKLTINDIDKEKLEQVAKLKSEKLATRSVDIMNRDALIELMKDFDVIINALPHELSIIALKAAIDAGVNTVDMVFEKEQMELHDAARSSGITIIPGCGVAPGISNILVRYGADKLDYLEEVHIKVGGLPQTPTPPLGYKIVFRLESVWEMYLRKARVVRNGELREKEPLSELETFKFPGIGELECALTDGLASLPYTLKGIKEMDEKTIRYLGHYEKIKTLIDCGLLSTKPIKVNNIEIAPQRFLTTLLSPALALEKGEKDLTILRVEVIGEKRGRKELYTFDMVDYYDEEQNITSMARTTAYTSTIVAKMVACGNIKVKGVKPPEEAIDPELFFKELANKNICIQETLRYPA